MSDIKFTDNSDEVLKALDRGISRALEAIGIEASGDAKENEYAVDTGRLRNSITWATKKNEGTSFSYKDDNGKGFTEQRPSGISEDEVIIGTAVKYAEGIEFGTHRKAGGVHFLKRAISENKSKYKHIAEESLKNT